MKRANVVTLGATIDSSVALGLASLALAVANQQRILPGGYLYFFEQRVTLLNVLFGVMFALCWKGCQTALGLYRESFRDFVRPTALSAMCSSIMTAVLDIYLQACQVHSPILTACFLFFGLSFLYTCLRIAVSSALAYWRHREPEQVIIVGSGRRAMKAWRELRLHHDRTKRLLGFVDDIEATHMAPDIAGRLVGSVADLSELFLNKAVDEIIIAMPLSSCYKSAQRAVSLAEAAGVRVVCLSDTYKLTYSKALRERTDLFHELVPKDEVSLNAEAFKRMIDVLAAMVGLLVLSPVYLGVALAVKLTSRGPIFFAQERCGYRRRTFRMYKFRSMVHNAPELMASLEAQNEAQGPIFKMRKDPRVTPLGRFLRSTSLDELPQLWNILIGDMSLVGPRPMSLRDVSRFDSSYLMRRFSVRPGLTGMWQVSARDSFSFEHWIALDFEYIDRWSLVLDLSILARTIPAVIRRVGAV